MPLSEILAVDTAKKLSGDATMHCFEIRTANVDFFVGEDSLSTEVMRYLISVYQFQSLFYRFEITFWQSPFIGV